MRELFDLAMDIGEQMLLCGAEVSRVEESVARMCLAMGAKKVAVFSITSNLTATFYEPGGDFYTQTRRIRSCGTDYEKLHILNSVSREICKKGLTANEIRERLSAAEKRKKYPLWAEFVCYGVIAGAFTLFFGGGFAETAVSLAIGLLMRFCILFTDKVFTNRILSKFFITAVASILAFIALDLRIVPAVDKIMIGNIMTLIPGIGLTNALRDLFTGDSIAGALRSLEAALAALAIAGGYIAVAAIRGALI